MRVLKQALALAFWLLVVISVLLASLVLISKVGLPLVSQYRPQIERNLSQLTGMKVSVGDVRAELNGVDIALNAQDIQVSTAEQNDAVSIGHFDFELDIIGSLLGLSLQFKNIVVSDVDIKLAEDGAGNVTLKGTRPNPSGSASNNIAASRVLNYLSDQRQMLLSGVSIELSSPRFDAVVFSVPATYLVNQGAKTLLRTDVFVNDMEQPIQLRSEISADLSSFYQQRAQAYIQIPTLNVPLEWTRSAALENVSSLSLGGEYWVTYQPNKGVTIQGQSSQLSAQFSDASVIDMAANWRLRQTQNGTLITVQGLHLENDAHQVSDVNIEGEWEAEKGRGYFVFDHMDAAIANDAALQFVPSDWYLAKLLSHLNPRGEARNGSLRLWRQDDALRYQYLSNVIQARVDGYDGIPRVDSASGVLSLSEKEGDIEFVANDATIAFPTVYDSAWQVERATGQVNWKSSDKAFVVQGNDLWVERDGATVRGEFRLENPSEGGVGEPWLSLDLNAQHVATKDKFTFVPPGALPESLHQWLESALGKGEASNVDVLLRTGLSKGAAPFIRLGIEAQVDRFLFDKAWPEGRNVSASVLLDGEGVKVDVKKAQWAGLPVQDVQVNVPLENGEAKWVNVAAKVKDDAGEIMAALRQTPLKTSVLEPFKDWRVAGDVSGNVSASVPIAGQSDAPKVNLDVRFKNNAVTISQLDLDAVVTSGELKYAPASGLNGTQLQLKALGGESHLVLRSSLQANDRLVVDGDLNGAVDTKRLLAWRDWPTVLSDNLSGRIVYQADLAVNRSQEGQVDVSINSSLEGVSSRFPEPFNKAEKATQRLIVQLKAFQNELMLDVSAANLAYAKLSFDQGVIQGGNISLFEPLTQAQDMRQGVTLKGQMEELDWHDWAPLWSDDKDGSATNESAPQPLMVEMPSWVRSINFLVDRIPINADNQLNNAKLTYDRTQDGHPLTLTSGELNAVLRTTQTTVPELHIAYLNWRTAQKSEVDTSANDDSGIQPSIIPSMQLRLDKVIVDNRPYGDWRAEVVNQGQNLRLNNVSTALPTGTFDGSIFWRGGPNPNVDISFTAKGDKAEELTQKFSSKPFIHSDSYDINAQLSWKDSLMAFSRESLNGRIRFNIKDGNFDEIDKIPPFLRVLGIFNVDALAKRLTFDFSDLYEQGMPFDHFSGDLEVKNGMLNTLKPVRVVSPTAEVELKGTANLIDETLQERLTATIPITSSLPVAGLLLGAPQVAGILYITDKLFGDQIAKVTSIQYEITGPFRDPKVKPVSPNKRK